MSFSNTFETRVLEFVFTDGAVTRPTNWYIGLFTAAPGEAGGGTEVAGNGYVRQSATFTVAGNAASNSASIDFPGATGSFGTVTHTAVFDALTGGNQIAYAALTTPKLVDTGDILRFPAGDIIVTLD